MKNLVYGNIFLPVRLKAIHVKLKTVNGSNLGQPDITWDSNSATISPNLQSHLI